MTTDTETKKKPQGIVAILVAPDGRELANVAEFGSSRPGGMSQREAQESRAHRSLALATMVSLASSILSEAIGIYLADQILREMCNKGCRVIIVPVGYDD